jgi:hypothetical protein
LTKIVKPTFEESLETIDKEIRKRKNKWNLTAVPSLDFDDVSQIIRTHIYLKWHLYNPKYPLAPWVNTVISAQIKNLLRNNYFNFVSPCKSCAGNEGDGPDGEGLCSVYIKQCAKCPIFAKWEKSKKQAYNVKLPVSLENHTQEVFDRPLDNVDVPKIAKLIHIKIEKFLKPPEFLIYKFLYIENKSEEEVAALMGYKTTEKGRAAGYKTIREAKKTIVLRVRKLIADGEIELI